jgi:hypothetical protein
VTFAGSVANLADRSAWCTFAGNGFGGGHGMIEFKGVPPSVSGTPD